MLRNRLNRIRNMPASEVRGRAKQEFLKRCESVLPVAAREMTDTELLRHLQYKSDLQYRSDKPGCVEDASQLLLDRIYRDSHSRHAATGRFPSLGERRAIADAMLRRFPEQRAAIIQKADNACAGRFDLMGFKGLSFGDPIKWRLEPLSGKTTPLTHWSRVDYLDPSVAGDKKITWELNRHQHFVTLGQAYLMTGDERYAAAFAGQVDSWMTSNPPGLGINWASSLELALRIISWIWSLYFFSGSVHLSPRLMARLLKFLVAQARHIDRFMSLYFSPNTHLTGEALGLLYLGTALPELSQSSYWRRRATSILFDQLSKQVLADGVYFERSTYYHRYTADFYTHTLLLIRGTSPQIEARIQDVLALMVDHMMWMTRPDGRSPLIGDDDGGRLITFGVTEPNAGTEDSVRDRRGPRDAGTSRRASNDFRDTLATAAAILSRPDWKYVAGDAAVETLWLLGPDGLEHYDAMRPLPPACGDMGFADGGFYIMRDGWSDDATVAILNSGNHTGQSAAHAHSDATSFEFAAAGSVWLVDPGTFTYTGSSKARDEFRTCLSHNVATVDGVACSEPGGPFRWKTLAQGYASQFSGGRLLSYFRGSHDGYLSLPAPVGCSRQFALLRASSGDVGWPSYVVISDDFFSEEGIHSYQTNFIFDPSCSVAADGGRVVARHYDGSRLDVFVHGNAAVGSSLRAASVSRCYGDRRPAPAVRFQSAGCALHQMVSVIVPSRGDLERRVHFNRDRADRWIEVRMESPVCQDSIFVSNSLRPPGSGCDRLNGSLGLVRRRRGVLEMALVDGDRFETDGMSILSSTVLEHCEVSVTGEVAEVRVQGARDLEVEIRIGGQSVRLESSFQGPGQVEYHRVDLIRGADQRGCSEHRKMRGN
jgi:hypothetical protein